MLSARLASRIASAPWFEAPWSPYSLLDADLHIRAVNDAFASATGMHRDVLIGQAAFEAFPDNPDDPSTDGVANVNRSLEHVLSRGTPHWMGFQRYDLPHPERPGAFVFKVWMPVNVPVTEHGRVVGVLHHVQDVTPTLGADAPAVVANHHPGRLRSALDSLQEQFPHAHLETVLGILTDSERIVLDVVRTPDATKTVELARLRLEARTRRPAVTDCDPA